MFTLGLIAGSFSTMIFVWSYPHILSFYEREYIAFNQEHDSNTTDKRSKIYLGSNIQLNENKTIADKLFNEVRVLCWILTGPANHETRAQHVKNTWGRRCNKLIFMSSVEDSKLGTVALPVSEGRQNLWAKTKEAFKYVYAHHLEEYDWFLKADDDTYVIMENLRKMLYAYSTEYPIFLGCKFRHKVKQGYMHGGPGYVLSKEALKRFIEKGLPDASKCRQGNNGFEDLELSICMENIEVLAGDSRDENEHETMLPYNLKVHLLPKLYQDKYLANMFYKQYEGFECCSHHAISFHYMKPHKMYIYEYFIYHLRPFGIERTEDTLPDKKSWDDIISKLYILSNNNTI